MGPQLFNRLPINAPVVWTKTGELGVVVARAPENDGWIIRWSGNRVDKVCADDAEFLERPASVKRSDVAPEEAERIMAEIRAANERRRAAMDARDRARHRSKPASVQSTSLF